MHLHSPALDPDLAGALDRDEFLLLYQPVVSLEGEAIVGFEALVRWQHPELGLISPADFVPIAERSGLIVPLGAWVLRHACGQLAAWQREGLARHDLWVSVNMSSVQFADPALVADVVEILRDTRLDPRCLMLELTEGVAMTDPAAVSALLTEIRALGVRVSVDDFGTGHSSLAYLRQLPLDYLKVDRSFVRGIDARDDLRGIFAAVAAMARQLDLRVIAEGIETPGQLAFVRALDAEFGQGFLLSHPVDTDAAASLLTGGLPVRPRENIDTAAAAGTLSGLGRPQSESPARTWLYAAAALVVVAASIGLPRVFVAGDVPPLTSGGTDIALATQPPAKIAERRAVPPRPRGPALAAKPRSVPPPVPQPSVPPPVTVSVIHQHRLGSCKGQLVATSAGLAFVPDEPGSGDAFSLEHHEFLPALEGDGLTIRASRRAYRFRSADVPGSSGADLRRLAESLTRFRAFP